MSLYLFPVLSKLCCGQRAIQVVRAFSITLATKLFPLLRCQLDKECCGRRFRTRQIRRGRTNRQRCNTQTNNVKNDSCQLSRVFEKTVDLRSSHTRHDAFENLHTGYRDHEETLALLEKLSLEASRLPPMGFALAIFVAAIGNLIWPTARFTVLLLSLRCQMSIAKLRQLT